METDEEPVDGRKSTLAQDDRFSPGLLGRFCYRKEMGLGGNMEEEVGLSEVPASVRRETHCHQLESWGSLGFFLKNLASVD